jgi:hypothetical protein
MNMKVRYESGQEPYYWEIEIPINTPNSRFKLSDGSTIIVTFPKEK